MAATAIWAVKSNLGKVVDYALNPNKTSLSDLEEIGNVLDYAANPKKTEQLLFVDGINCDPQIAKEQMKLTKKSWGKESGILAFHAYQSFAPGEATPELAHEIGVEFARRMWGDRFQVVVATHLDREHLHNHFVLNSVSFKDGKKYYASKKTYYGDMRKTSDKLCEQYGLSVIEPSGKNGKHYAEHLAESEGRQTIRGMIREDVDKAIRKSFTFTSFVENLRKQGYAVKYGPNVKHIAIKPANGGKYIRLKSLGDDYTEDAIKNRLAAIREGNAPQPEPPTAPKLPEPARRYFAVNPIPRRRNKKYRGFIALYFHYLYLLGKTKKGKLPNRAAFLLRDDVIRFNQYQKQFAFLHRYNIQTSAEFETLREAVQAKIDYLTETRKPLYRERRLSVDEIQIEDLTARIDEATDALRNVRAELATCGRIAANIPRVQETTKKIAQQKRERQARTKDIQKARKQPIKKNVRE